jgi:glycosyltransferase involved in cell wall biosynthesis
MGRPESIKILYVDHGEGLGGAEYSLLLLMRYLDPSRFKPVLACGSGPLARAAQTAAIDTRITSVPQLRGRPTALLQLGRSGRVLAQLIRSEQADFVHANTMRASFTATLAARLARRPLIWHARDIYGAGQIGSTWYPALMSRLARAVVANSRAVARTIPRRDVRVIYNGVELDRFAPDREARAVRTALGLSECDVLIGTIGRMQPWKGHHHFIEAAARVSLQLPQVQFLIVGGRVFQADADYEQQLRTQAIELGLGDRMHFVGQRENVQDWLAAMDIFAHCSQAEPFGRVVVEAMAAARPVVAFADGGVPEIVVDGETGQLTPPGDVSALARALFELAADRDRATRLGRAGRVRAEEVFSAEAHARQMEDLYLELVSS